MDSLNASAQGERRVWCCAWEQAVLLGGILQKHSCTAALFPPAHQQLCSLQGHPGQGHKHVLGVCRGQKGCAPAPLEKGLCKIQ